MGCQNCFAIGRMKVLLLLALVVSASSAASSFKAGLQDGTQEVKGLCNLCKDIVSAGERFLTNFDTLERDEAMEECSKIPIVGSLCEKFAEKILDAIENGDPEEVCTEVKACP